VPILSRHWAEGLCRGQGWQTVVHLKADSLASRFDWAALGVHGTVFCDGESSTRRASVGGPLNLPTTPLRIWAMSRPTGGEVWSTPSSDPFDETPSRVHDQPSSLTCRPAAYRPAAGSHHPDTLTGSADEIANG